METYYLWWSLPTCLVTYYMYTHTYTCAYPIHTHAHAYVHMYIKHTCIYGTEILCIYPHAYLNNIYIYIYKTFQTVCVHHFRYIRRQTIHAKKDARSQAFRCKLRVCVVFVYFATRSCAVVMHVIIYCKWTLLDVVWKLVMGVLVVETRCFARDHILLFEHFQKFENLFIVDIVFTFYHDMQISWPDSGSPPIRLSDS